MKMIRGAASAVLLGAGILGSSSHAWALAGTHPIVVSSWDARASSVALEYRHGFMKDGGFNDVAYSANFSSTSGKLSAQFGLHYVNFKAEAGDPRAQSELQADQDESADEERIRKHVGNLPTRAYP